MKKTMQEEGYKFCKYLYGGLAVFQIVENGGLEVFAANKNHASWGFKWNNTDWEFVRSATLEDLRS